MVSRRNSIEAEGIRSAITVVTSRHSNPLSYGLGFFDPRGCVGWGITKSETDLAGHGSESNSSNVERILSIV